MHTVQVLNHFLIRLHHRAGSNPLELHGSVYEVICLECLNVVHPSVENHSRRNVVNNIDPCWKLEIYRSHVRCWVQSLMQIYLQVRKETDRRCCRSDPQKFVLGSLTNFINLLS